MGGANSTTLPLAHNNLQMQCIQRSELENLNDVEWLDSNGFSTFDLDGDEGANQESENEDVVESFFGENPFKGSRVRQSGMLANDLYVKSSYLFGGTLSLPRGGKKRKEEEVDDDDYDDDDVANVTSKSDKTKKSKPNSALI